MRVGFDAHDMPTSPWYEPLGVLYNKSITCMPVVACMHCHLRLFNFLLKCHRGSGGAGCLVGQTMSLWDCGSWHTTFRIWTTGDWGCNTQMDLAQMTSLVSSCMQHYLRAKCGVEPIVSQCAWVCLWRTGHDCDHLHDVGVNATSWLQMMHRPPIILLADAQLCMTNNVVHVILAESVQLWSSYSLSSCSACSICLMPVAAACIYSWFTQWGSYVICTSLLAQSENTRAQCWLGVAMVSASLRSQRQSYIRMWHAQSQSVQICLWWTHGMTSVPWGVSSLMGTEISIRQHAWLNTQLCFPHLCCDAAEGKQSFIANTSWHLDRWSPVELNVWFIKAVKYTHVQHQLHTDHQMSSFSDQQHCICLWYRFAVLNQCCNVAGMPFFGSTWRVILAVPED